MKELTHKVNTIDRHNSWIILGILSKVQSLRKQHKESKSQIINYGKKLMKTLHLKCLAKFKSFLLIIHLQPPKTLPMWRKVWLLTSLQLWVKWTLLSMTSNLWNILCSSMRLRSSPSNRKYHACKSFVYGFSWLSA